MLVGHLAQAIDIVRSVQNVHPAMAVGTQRNRVLNGIVTASCKPHYVMTLEVWLAVLVLEWCLLRAQLTLPARSPTRALITDQMHYLL